MDIDAFVSAVLRQDADLIRTFFWSDAYVNWHNTNEHFTVEEYIRANCEYPGEWTGQIEQVVESGELIVAATHVQSLDGEISCHCTSFIRLIEDKIASIDEYWGDDGEVPQWRKEKRIGTPIKGEKEDGNSI